jgi:hypothetical protein
MTALVSRSDDGRELSVGKPGSVPYTDQLRAQTEAAGDGHLDSRGGRDPDVRERASRPLSSEAAAADPFVRRLEGHDPCRHWSLLTLLLALVLGTLVGNTYAFFAMPAQKDALAAAKANLALMEQTRLLMSLQLSSPVAWSLVTSVILWSMFLFCGFGVLSGTNPTTIVALALGAISVASAMFLILDLTQPYSGLFRVPPSAIQQTLEAIER